MGAKDWILVYAEQDVATVLRAEPQIDRAATERLVRRLFSHRRPVPRPDRSLAWTNPVSSEVYAGCFGGVTVIATDEAALDQPTQLDPRFLAECNGRNLYLHAMHSVVDWFAFAVWLPDGSLVRALSVSPEGIIENVGAPLDFELPYWAGEHPVGWDDHPLPFHPLELGEAALRALFGFNYEGEYHDDDLDLDQILLAGFALEDQAQRRRWSIRSRTH